MANEVRQETNFAGNVGFSRFVLEHGRVHGANKPKTPENAAILAKFLDKVRQKEGGLGSHFESRTVKFGILVKWFPLTSCSLRAEVSFLPARWI